MLDPTPKRTKEQKVIVYKTIVDPITMRLTVEKIKTLFYSKYGLLKPSPEIYRYYQSTRNTNPTP